MPQVNLKLFAPEPNRRKTVLLFVIRDKSKTPLAKVRRQGGFPRSSPSIPAARWTCGQAWPSPDQPGTSALLADAHQPHIQVAPRTDARHPPMHPLHLLQPHPSPLNLLQPHLRAQLAETLGEDVAKMWDSISKPPQYVGSKISDFFEIQYAALPHYEEKYDDFVADTTVLRRR